MKKRYIYENVEVINIVDGDTLDVNIDLGFDIWKKARLRLYGINAPETKGDTAEAGKASTDYLTSLIPVGTFVKIECLGQDKYGRWLAILHKDDIILNEHLIENGYAERYMN